MPIHNTPEHLLDVDLLEKAYLQEQAVLLVMNQADKLSALRSDIMSYITPEVSNADPDKYVIIQELSNKVCAVYIKYRMHVRGFHTLLRKLGLPGFVCTPSPMGAAYILALKHYMPFNHHKHLEGAMTVDRAVEILHASTLGIVGEVEYIYYLPKHHAVPSITRNFITAADMERMSVSDKMFRYMVYSRYDTHRYYQQLVNNAYVPMLVLSYSGHIKPSVCVTGSTLLDDPELQPLTIQAHELYESLAEADDYVRKHIDKRMAKPLQQLSAYLLRKKLS